jgi:hypothetical protein
MATLAPWEAAIRAARTPPEPPPITNKSKSKVVMLLKLDDDTCHDKSKLLIRYIHPADVQ